MLEIKYKNGYITTKTSMEEKKMPVDQTRNLNYHVDTPETAEIKRYALEVLRADLVGIANIERFASAPLRMSPQGIMPSAKSVIVMAVHHPDAAMERGGLKHPQEIGPYAIQYSMNWRLDDMSYRMSRFVEDLGYQTVPIASSNIWRYRGYKDLTAQFAPDVSHLHCAVACGLAEFGYNGLAITPEFGAHQRYVTIITDAVLTPTPLLEPGSVCDNCMICRKECRSGALSKEINGWNEVKIEDKVYRYANKNLWRCAWGEHFDLDLDLPIPEHVDEKVIMEATIKYGRRAGEMGSCQRYCIPRGLRYFDKEYTNAPRRRRQFIANPEVNAGFHRGLFEQIRSLAAGWGADNVVVASAETVRAKMNIELGTLLPGATAIVSVIACRNPFEADTDNPRAHENRFDNAVRVLENHGYTAGQMFQFPEEEFQKLITPAGKKLHSVTLLTDAPLPETGWELPDNCPVRAVDSKTLTKRIRREMEMRECDLVGIAPAERIDSLLPQLKNIFEGEVELVARNTADTIYKPYEPEIIELERHVTGTADYLAGAKSVIMLGLRMPSGSVDITARTPAEAAGPYVFAQYETIMRLRVLAWNVIGRLEEAGYKGAMAVDLHGTGSVCWNPRGNYPDAFSNVFAAAAAGLGSISECGSIVTPEFGSNVRFVAVITDAPLEYNDVLRNQILVCKECNKRCVKGCKTSAFGELKTVELEGTQYSFRKIDINRCNWAKRYSLIASEGNQYTGWDLDEAYPENADLKTLRSKLDESLRKVPQIEKIRPCNFEQCLLECPYSRKQN